jgi:hypothetical protein
MNVTKGLPALRGCSALCIPRVAITAGVLYNACREHEERTSVEKRAFVSNAVDHSVDGVFSPCRPVPASCGGLCSKCFCAFHGIHMSYFYRIKQRMQTGDRSFVHQNKGRRKGRSNTCNPETVTHWVLAYAKRTGDFMPDVKEIHLPDYRWTYVHQKAKRELNIATTNSRCPTYNHFRKIVRDTLPYIKIRKWKRFTKCTDCKQLDELISKNLGSVRTQWKKKKEQHQLWADNERAKYHKHREEATNKDTRHRSMCISIDGMDHSKTSCGNLDREDKDTEKNVKLETHVTGVLVHGRDPCAYVYTWYDRFPSGSDVVTTILVDVLRRVQDGEPLPPRLNLWLDNCWRENKNK